MLNRLARKVLHKELDQYREESNQLQNELNKYKTHYEQYRMIQDTFINKHEVLKDLQQLGSEYKRVMIPLLDMIKANMTEKAIKKMNHLDYMFYINGVLWGMDTLKQYIQWTLTEKTKEDVSLLTRKPL